MSIRAEDKVVKYCRFVFRTNRLEKYNKYWIDTKKLENLEVMNDLCHIEIDLYPKTIKLDEQLKKLGITPPPKFISEYPKKPKIENYLEYENYIKNLQNYKIAKKLNRNLWRAYRKEIYKIIHDDINKNKNLNIKPITIMIDKKFIEKQKNNNTKLIEMHYVKTKNK